MKYKVKFRISGANHKRSKFSLNLEEGKKLTVGSGTSFLQLTDASVAKVHCYVTIREGQTYVQDRSEKLGTRVNNQNVQEKTLRPGDVVQIGVYSIEVLVCPFVESQENGQVGEGTHSTQFIDIDELNALKEQIANSKKERTASRKPVTGAASIRPAKRLQEEDVSHPIKSDGDDDLSLIELEHTQADGMSKKSGQLNPAVPVKAALDEDATQPLSGSDEGMSGYKPIMGTKQIEKIKNRSNTPADDTASTEEPTRSRSKLKENTKTKTKSRTKTRSGKSQKDMPAAARIRIPSSLTADMDRESDTERHPLHTRTEMVSQEGVESQRSYSDFLARSKQKFTLVTRARESKTSHASLIHLLITVAIASLSGMGCFHILFAQAKVGFGDYLFSALVAVGLLGALSWVLVRFGDFIEASGNFREYYRYFAYCSGLSIPVSYFAVGYPQLAWLVIGLAFCLVVWTFISKFGPLLERFLVLVGGFVAIVSIAVMVIVGGNPAKRDANDTTGRDVASNNGNVVKPIQNAILKSRGNQEIELQVMRYFTATVTGDIKTVKSLVDTRQVETDRAFISGHTALMAAAENRQSNILEYLLIKGAQVDMADPTGYTALMHAVQAEDEVAVEMLLKYGASVFPRSARNETAVDIAKRLQARKIEFMVRNPDKYKMPDEELKGLRKISTDAGSVNKNSVPEQENEGGNFGEENPEGSEELNTSDSALEENPVQQTETPSRRRNTAVPSRNESGFKPKRTDNRIPNPVRLVPMPQAQLQRRKVNSPIPPISQVSRPLPMPQTSLRREPIPESLPSKTVVERRREEEKQRETLNTNPLQQRRTSSERSDSSSKPDQITEDAAIRSPSVSPPKAKGRKSSILIE